MDMRIEQSRALIERDVWVFDLDNTLYPAECDLFDQVRLRMGEYISNYFSINIEEARILQRKYFLKYGTTLRGLMTVDKVDPKEYLAHVEDIDLGNVAPNSALGSALDGLPGRKVIFTNASAFHAERVLDRLGIADRFEAIFDVEAAGFVPKPNLVSYEALLKKHDIAPDRAAMVEDMSINLEPAHALGMTTILVETGLEWADSGTGNDHVHHVVEDLPQWLSDLAARHPSATVDK